jgi:hypothetical protein
MHTLRANTSTRPGSLSPANRRQIRTGVYRTTLRNAAVAVALAGAALTAQASVKASAVTLVNWYSPLAEVFVPLNAAGATTLNFNLTSAGKKLLTYSAICSVGSQPGDTTGFVQLDIYVNGVIVAPTFADAYVGEDPFCSADGTFGVGDGMVRASITVPIEGIKGNNTVRIQASRNGPAWGFVLGKSSLVISD